MLGRDEDHTLGNALRHVLMQNAEVDFCGYSVPHPSEPKMNLRLQTTGVCPRPYLRLRLSMLGVRIWFLARLPLPGVGNSSYVIVEVHT